MTVTQHDGIWSVHDESGVVFSGTYRECEDWLDWNENRRRE